MNSKTPFQYLLISMFKVWASLGCVSSGKGMYFLYHGKLAYAYLLDDVSFDAAEEDWMNSPETSCFIANGFISEAG